MSDFDAIRRDAVSAWDRAWALSIVAARLRDAGWEILATIST